MKFLLSSVLLISTFAYGDSNSCTKGKLPFFQNYSRFKASPAKKLKALDKACKEINNDMFMDKETGLNLLKYKFINVVGFGLRGEVTASFSTLNGSEEGRAYMRALKKIKQIKNPVERIAQTYRLAVINSGEYDHETMGNQTLYSGFVFGAYRPENLLRNSRDRGTIGVCREFAALLKWSLLQVARHPNSQSPALEATDFSAETESGNTPVGQHGWVRINLPVYKEGRLSGFIHFDLDTTWYPDFTPLFPRRSGVSDKNLRRLRRECEELALCLSKY